MTKTDENPCCDAVPSKELTERLCQIEEIQVELAREFTKVLNAKGIRGSVLGFAVYEQEFDVALETIGTTQGIGLGIWTCPPDCVCGGLGGRF